MSLTRPSLSRLIAVHEQIAQGKYPSVTGLAETLQVATRTVKRDLRALREEHGAPLAYDRARDGYYYRKPFSLMKLPLTDEELVAVCLMQAAAPAFRNTHLGPAIAGALMKLQHLLPDTVWLGKVNPEHLAVLPDAAPPETACACANFKRLLEAATQRRVVRLRVFVMKNKREETRTVEPYLLYLENGAWYVHGRDRERADTRDFALHRIREVTVMPETFPAPDLSIVKGHLAERFSNFEDQVEEIAIHFDADAARYITERIWHPTQQLTPDTDGGATLKMRVSGMPTVAHWILSFAGHAVPLAPESLVTGVKQDVARLQKAMT